MKNVKINFPFYIVKRMNISKRNAWLIRIGGMLAAFLLSGILCTIISPGTFGEFFSSMFRGTFGTSAFFINLLCCFSTYLLLALAVTPAFKMKFWNIGVEGQAMVGCIVTAVILLLVPASVPGPVVIVMALFAGIAAGAIWAVIPTLFKIKFNTNETLFTLLMNYVATALAAFTIAKCTRGGSGTFPMITDNSRLLVDFGGVKYIPFIVCAVLFTIFMIFYLGKSKHGFELSVLGVSKNTARYVGININRVTLRTMILSGAIAGLVGFLLVCGQYKTLTSTLVGGKGFTAVLIAWLGHFNPSEIAVYSFIVGFLDQGTSYAASKVKVSKNYFSGLIIGLFILIVVLTEFFVRYKVKRHESDKVLDARSKVKVFEDAKTNEQVLLKEFLSYKASEYFITLQSTKKEYLNNKKETKAKIKELKKKILFGFKLNPIDREKLNGNINSLNKKLSDLNFEFKKYKEELKIKKRCQATIVMSNCARVFRVIRKNVKYCIEQGKDKLLIFNTKDDLNIFIKNFVFTNWKISSKPTIGACRVLKKKWKTLLKDFKDKCINNKATVKDAQNVDRAYFEYLIICFNRSILRYLKDRNRYLRFQLKSLNRHNRKVIKKKGGAHK